MNTEIVKKETFVTDTEELGRIEARIAVHIQDVRRSAIEIGRCLNEAKDRGLVSHGEWEDWVRANTGLQPRNAQRLMQAAREVPEGSILGQLEVSKITAILALPAEEREEMARRAQEESMTVKELRAAVEKERRRGDYMIKRFNKLTSDKEAMAAEYEKETGALRDQLREALEKPKGISGAAQKRIDELNSRLSEAEAYAEEQAGLRQKAQQELLNMTMGQGGSPSDDPRGTEILERAVREFLAKAGIMLFMSDEIAIMDSAERARIERQLNILDDWTGRVRRKLDTVVVEAV